MYEFTLDLGHGAWIFKWIPSPNDGALLALDGVDLIAVNGAITPEAW